MPSSKGEPTDPELREKIKEEVKAEEKGEISPSVSIIYLLLFGFTDMKISFHRWRQRQMVRVEGWRDGQTL